MRRLKYTLMKSDLNHDQYEKDLAEFESLKTRLEDIRECTKDVIMSKDVYIAIRKKVWNLNDRARQLHLRMISYRSGYPMPSVIGPAPVATEHSDHYITGKVAA